METPSLPICATVKKQRWHLAKHKVVSCWEGQNYPKWQLPITEKLGHLSNKQPSLCPSSPCSQTHCLNGSCLLCTKIRKVHEREVRSWAESQNPCKGLYWRENTAVCKAAGSDSSPCSVSDFQCDLAHDLHCPGLPFLIYEERVLKWDGGGGSWGALVLHLLILMEHTFHFAPK